MRFASKLMLLALLALPVGSAFAAAVSSLNIQITVTVSDTVDVQFCDSTGTGKGTADQPWALGIALGGNADNPGTIYTDILNNGKMQVTVNVSGTNGASAWTIADAPAPDKFTITATKNGGGTVALTNAGVSYGTAIAGTGHTTGTKLNFAAPTTVTHMGQA